ncbi:hypothetical protein BG452_07605 [Streptomyces sp. CBMA123]|nr:hypothetical protein [Streptomyces sp. CBMA123]
MWFGWGGPGRPGEQKIGRRQAAGGRRPGPASARHVPGAITVSVSHRFSTVSGVGLMLVIDQGHSEETGWHLD